MINQDSVPPGRNIVFQPGVDWWQKRLLITAVITVIMLVIFSGIDDTPLTNSTETRVAGIATQMYLDQDYVVPKLNGQPFLEKPPLYSWLTVVSYKIFGISYWSSRLPSALAAIGLLILLSVQMRARKYPIAVQLVSILTLVTMAEFWSYSRTASQDMVLAFGVALSLLSLYRYLDSDHYRYLVPSAVGIAIAAMAKGVFGISVIIMVVLPYFLLSNRDKDRGHWLKQFFALGVAFSCGLIPLAIWLWFLYAQAGWDAFYTVTWVNSVGRFLGQYQHGGHVEAWYYYLARVPVLFEPWLPIVFVGVWYLVKEGKLSGYRLLLICWLFAPIFLLSLSSSKREVYLLSIYPSACLLITDAVNRFYRIGERTLSMQHARLPRHALSFQLFLSTILLAGVFYLALFKWQAGLYTITVAAISALALFAAVFYRVKADVGRALAWSLASICLLFIVYGGVLDPNEGKARSYEAVFDNAVFSDANAEIGLYRPQERTSGAAVYYLRRVVKQLDTPEELAVFMRQYPDHVVISEDKELLKLPGDIQKISVSSDTMYVLTR
ncbi:glycosyltransferase family 39 protein [Microbulbifer sp. SAOS-129_SWC]|uniref:ArnT family glycosyltransferase n=1 Tax=Microbulbifer sp. SAOS-129_SWC TaxID=3145235 RepID=UPI003217BAAE